MRTDTFYPRLGLLQVGDDGTQYLIDPIAISDVDALKPVFIDQNPLKVLHACSEDLEVFKTIWGQVPGSLFDTQVAASFLGFGLQIGYQGLLKKTLGIDIDKGETRSDWCQRPLTDKQKHYAAQDVAYLENVYDLLTESLNRQSRLSWVQEDCDALLSAAAIEVIPERYYLKFRHAWRLDNSRQQLLKTLCTWRELEARQRDKPRSFIVKDVDILAIVQSRQLPDMPQKLLDLGLHPITVKKESEALLSILSEAINDDELEEKLEPPVPISAKPLISLLKAAAKEKAYDLELPIEVLASKKTIEAFIMSCVKVEPEAIKLKSQWRNEILYKNWMKIIHNQQEVLNCLKTYFNESH